MNDYCVIKLVTGEQLIGEVTDKNHEGFVVANPIVVKQIPTMAKNGDISERVVTSRYCSYTSESTFFFRDRDILFAKPLKESITKHYLNLVKQFFSESNSLYFENDYEEEDEDDENPKEKVSNIIH